MVPGSQVASIQSTASAAPFRGHPREITTVTPDPTSIPSVAAPQFGTPLQIGRAHV